jgi:GAF domain-containing protein
MRRRDRVIGALNVFGRGTGALGDEEVDVVQALADVATIAIIQERAIARADVLNEQLKAALDSRIAVEQAKGAVAAVFGVSVGAAFEMIRRHARTARVPLTALALELLEDPGRMGELGPGS